MTKCSVKWEFGNPNNLPHLFLLALLMFTLKRIIKTPNSGPAVAAADMIMAQGAAVMADPAAATMVTIKWSC